MRTSANKRLLQFKRDLVAIFHLHIKHIGRASGGSAVCASAYRSGSSLSEFSLSADGTEKQKTFNFSNKVGVAFSEIFAPQNAALWMKNRESLWNRIQSQFDTRVNSVFAQEVTIALPIELTLEENIILLKDFVQKSLVEEGMIVDANLHMDNPQNPHAHLMLSTREVVRGEDGEFTFGKKVRYWDRRDFLIDLRKNWAFYINQALARQGIDDRVVSSSNRNIGIKTIPTIKEGVGRFIDDSARSKQNLEIRGKNAEMIRADPTILVDIISAKKSLFTRRDLELAWRKYDDSGRGIDIINSVLDSRRIECASLRDPNGRVLYRDALRSRLESSFLNLIELIKQEGQVLHHMGVSIEDLLCHDLTLEQQSGAYNVLNSGAVSIIDGLPGSGKTSMLKKVADIYKQYGKKIVVTAVSSNAAEHIGSVLGVKAMNLTKLRFIIENRSLKDFELDISLSSAITRPIPVQNKVIDSKTVLIIDEATMVDLTEMNFFLSLAYSTGAKIILIGDKNQLLAMRFKGAYEKLLEHFKPISMSNIVRQKNPHHRVAIDAISQKQLDQALEAYWNSFIFVSNGKIAITRLSSDYAQSFLLGEGKTILALASSRRSVFQLNRSIRQNLRDSGYLGSKDYLLKITQENTLIECNFSVGDRVIFTRNDAKLGVFNNDRGEIRSITGNRVRIKLDRKINCLGIKLSRYVHFDNRLFNHFDLGYASTIHKAQGLTSDYTYCLFDHNVNYRSFNVLASRHREDLHIYCSDNMLREHWGKVYSGRIDYDASIGVSRKNSILSIINSTDNILFEEDYRALCTATEDIVDNYLDEQQYLSKLAYSRARFDNQSNYFAEMKKSLSRRRIFAEKISADFEHYRQKLALCNISPEIIYCHAGKRPYKFSHIYQNIYTNAFQALVGHLEAFYNMPKGDLFREDNNVIIGKIHKSIQGVWNYQHQNERLIIELENQIALQKESECDFKLQKLQAKIYVEKSFPAFLSQIYESDTQQIAEELSLLYNKISKEGNWSQYHHLSKLGKFKGVGWGQYMPFSSIRYKAVSNFFKLPSRISEYMECKSLLEDKGLLANTSDKLINLNLELRALRSKLMPKEALEFISDIADFYQTKDQEILCDELNYFLNKSEIQDRLLLYRRNFNLLKRRGSDKSDFQKRDYLPQDIESIFRKYAPKINPDGKIHIKNSQIISGSLTMNLKNGLWYRFSTSEGGNIDTFLKLNAGERAFNSQSRPILGFKKRKMKRTIAWEPYDKIPTYAKKFNPPEDCRYHIGEGSLDGIYKYQDLQGNLLGYSVRICMQDKKKVIPFAYCRLKKKEAWMAKDFSKQEGYKPIYGMEKLANNTEPVLIVEGEKTADIASKFLPNFKVISWLGGVGSVDKVNWEILKDREVYIWPDNDDAGKKAAQKIAVNIKNMLGRGNLVCINPEYFTIGDRSFSDVFPHKWDLADRKPDTIKDIQYGSILCSAKENLGSAKKISFVTDKENRIYWQHKLLGLELGAEQVKEKALFEERIYNILDSDGSKKYIELMQSKGEIANNHEFLTQRNEFYKNILVSVAVSQNITIEAEDKASLIHRLEEKYIATIQNFSDHVPYLAKYSIASGKEELYSIILRDIFFLQKNQNGFLLNSQKDLLSKQLRNIMLRAEMHQKNDMVYVANKAYIEICSAKFFQSQVNKAYVGSDIALHRDRDIEIKPTNIIKGIDR